MTCDSKVGYVIEKPYKHKFGHVKMKRLYLTKFFYIQLIIFSISTVGCCVSQDFTILNNTSKEIALVSGHTKSIVSIKPMKKEILPHSSGAVTIVADPYVWIYDSLTVLEYPDSKEKEFRLGVCRCGFGYYTVNAVLDENGNLAIGESIIAPSKSIKWNSTEQH